MNWSDDQFQTLKRLVDRGLSASQIGQTLGVTRNAVIGKVHRAGLAFSKGAPPPKSEWRKQAWRQAAKKNMADKKSPPSATELVEPESVATPVTLIELTAAHCRWPVDRVLYCGAERLAGSVYCARHDRVAHHRGPA